MPLRVTIVTPWGERLGGAEEMLWLALSHCDRARIEPTVVFLGPGRFASEVAELGLASEVIPAGRLRQVSASLKAVSGLTALLRRTQPDLVLAWSAKAQIYTAPAATLAGMRDRLVWWQHQIPVGHWVDRVATLLPARAIGCSSNAGQRAQGTLSPRRRSFVVNPGIEIGRAHEGNRAELREQLDIPAGRQVLGIVGRLQPWKGQDRFLAALAELHRGGRDVHGLLVGGDAYELSPEYAAGLERLVRELGLSGRVTMTGQVPDSAPYLELMDVAVNASEEEPFGIVLLEAMAAGVPVVAVDKGGPVDIVEPGVSGMLARNGEPAELATAIDALLADSSLRAEMAVAAKNRCRQRFSAELMVEKLTTQLSEFRHG